MTGSPLALRFARRELRGGLRGFYVFLACLALGVGAIAAIGSVAATVEAGLRADAKFILGGDVDIRLVHREATPEQFSFIGEGADVARTVEMRAMARPLTGARVGDDLSQTLVELKAVDGLYPLYGTVELDPPLPLTEALAPEGAAFGAVVDRSLMTRLDVKLGERLRIGEAEFIIRAILAFEPDRGARAFTLGPRVMVARDALAATELIQPGSLVSYHYRLRFHEPQDMPAWTERLRDRFPEAGWRVRGPENAAPRVRLFVDRVSMFLTLVGLSALLVGGVGAANATKNYIDGRTATIATLKCLGAPGALIFRTYFIQILVLAGLAIVAGLVLGAAVPLLLIVLYGDQLPVATRLGLYPAPLAIAAVFGLLTAVAFSVWPLARAQEIPGARLFRDLVSPSRRWPRGRYIAICVAAVAALIALAVATAHDKAIALWFVAAVTATLLIFRGAAWLTALCAARAGKIAAVMHGRPGIRLALANMHRPGAPTPSVVLSLGLGLTVLVAVAQIQGNMALRLTDQVPEAAPSYYFIDIQPDQAAAFETTVSNVPGAQFIERVPSLRGRIVKIAGVPVEKASIASDVMWTVRSERGLTYAAEPPPGSTITAGEWWPADYAGPPLISLDEAVAHGFGIGLGDSLTINVLGRDLTARIASLRRIDWQTLSMNFVIVFDPASLKSAPHTNIATALTSEAAENPLVRAVTQSFPNVSAIRVKDALAAADRILSRLGVALRVTAGVTLAAGALVLAGAVAAGHRRRVYDSVVLKVLGATRRVVLGAYLMEYGLLGLATAAIAAILGTLASFFVLTEIMEFDWTFLARETAFAALGAASVTLVFGFFGIWRALGQKAAPLLRNR